MLMCTSLRRKRAETDKKSPPVHASNTITSTERLTWNGGAVSVAWSGGVVRGTHGVVVVVVRCQCRGMPVGCDLRTVPELWYSNVSGGLELAHMLCPCIPCTPAAISPLFPSASEEHTGRWECSAWQVSQALVAAADKPCIQSADSRVARPLTVDTFGWRGLFL